MWMTEKIARPLRESPVENGRAAAFQTAGFAATGSAQRQNVPLYLPAGMVSIPCQGAQVLLIPCAGETVCAGVRTEDTQGLLPGEIRLFSAGGASLTLKNSGEIELNGAAVAKDGTLRVRKLEEVR